MSIKEILILLYITTFGLNNLIALPHIAQGFLRPAATKLTRASLSIQGKSSSAGRTPLRSLITEESPPDLSDREKRIWKIASKTARYLVREELARSFDEIFGLCYSGVRKLEEELRRDSDREPLARLSDSKAIEFTKRNVFDSLRLELEATGISEGTKLKIIKAIESIKALGKQASVKETADLSGVGQSLVTLYFKIAGRFYGVGQIEEVDANQAFLKSTTRRQPRLSSFSELIAETNFAERQTDIKFRTGYALSKLWGDFGAVVYLLYIEERPLQEIAFILNFSPSRISQLNKQAIEIFYSSTPDGNVVTIEDVRKQVYQKYADRLKIAGRYEDNIESRSKGLEPSTPLKDIELLKKAIGSFPEEAADEAEIAQRLYLEGKDTAEVRKELGLSHTLYGQRKFNAHIYLNHYLQGRGLIGYIIRRIGFSKEQTADFTDILCLCYKNNIPVVNAVSYKVYDGLREETVELTRLNDFNNYKDSSDGHLHISRDLKLAKEKGILRVGISQIYPKGGRAGIGNIYVSIQDIYTSAKLYGLRNGFNPDTRIGCKRYFQILKEVKANRDLYSGNPGLIGLSKKFNLKPETIYKSFSLDFVKDMGWSLITEGGAKLGIETERILRAITSAA